MSPHIKPRGACSALGLSLDWTSNFGLWVVKVVTLATQRFFLNELPYCACASTVEHVCSECVDLFCSSFN